MRKLVKCSLALLSLCLSACSLPFEFSAEESHYFVLEQSELDNGFEIERGAKPLGTLVIRDVDAPNYLNSKRIVFRNRPLSRGYYQYSFWVEPVPNRLTALLREAIDASALFSSVAKESSGTRADFLITASLVEFHHDTSSKPGEVEIVLDMQLVDLKTRNVVSSMRVEQSQEVERFEAEGAVRAFEKGVTEVLREIVSWLQNSSLSEPIKN